MTVLRPVKVVITNFPDDHVDYVDVINNPEDPSAGTRPVPFTRELYIEREDFMEDPPKKFFRLSPGKEVRLIAVARRDATWIRQRLETSEAVGEYRVHEVD